MSFYSFSVVTFINQFLPTRKRTLKHVAWLKSLLAPLQWSRDTFFNSYADGFTGTTVGIYNPSQTYAIGDLVFYNSIIYECIAVSTGNLPTDVTYFSVKSFSFQDTIRHTDKGVYYAIKDNPNGIAPFDTEYWERVQSNFIGVNERIKANAQIIKFEYIMNKWFGTNFNYPTSTNDVYIVNTRVDYNSFIVGFNETESGAVYVDDTEQEKYINDSYTPTTTNYSIYIPLDTYDGLSPLEPTGTTSTKEAIARDFIDKYNLAGMSYKIIPY